MDGKNSDGCRISLLNDEVRRPPGLPLVLSHRPRHTCISPPYQPLQSRPTNYRSSSIESPPTPLLVRSDSSDSSVSSDSAAMQTPSPVTPEFPLDARYMYDSHSAPMYPVRPSPKFYRMSYPPPYESVSGNWGDFGRPQQAPDSRAVPASATRSKKNSYPCPMAQQYNCNDYFTTSGHAARHAKKHTGKKDAVCPDCNKAFTRKDNMEQHRRTHQSGRNATKVGEDRTKKSSKQQMRRPKPAPIQASLSPVPSLVDPALSPTRIVFPMATSHYSYEVPYPQRSPYPDHMDPLRPHYSEVALQTLADAASGAKRKFEAAA